MSFVNFEAKAYGKTQQGLLKIDHKLSITLSKIDVELLSSLDSSSDEAARLKRMPIIAKVLEKAYPTIMTANPWLCPCKCRATKMHHSPRIQQFSNPLIIYDFPMFVCDKPVCMKREKFMEYIVDKSPLGWYRLYAGMILMNYTCTHCDKSTSTMFTCSICKTGRYCSKACQKASWKDGHKRICSFKKIFGSSGIFLLVSAFVVGAYAVSALAGILITVVAFILIPTYM